MTTLDLDAIRARAQRVAAWAHSADDNRLAKHDVPALIDTVDRLCRRLAGRFEETTKLRALVARLVEPYDDPCQLDHHGYCQAHNLHSPPCPAQVAKELLATEDEEPTDA